MWAYTEVLGTKYEYKKGTPNYKYMGGIQLNQDECMNLGF